MVVDVALDEAIEDAAAPARISVISAITCSTKPLVLVFALALVFALDLD